MQIRRNSKRNQRVSTMETNYRLLPVIFVMPCLMLLTSTLASGRGWDYGDAPDPTYPTLAASDGAMHAINLDVFLGSGVDADPVGQHTVGATGDDNDGNDDEDGVILPSSLTPGSTANVTVTASVDGYLSAWIDFSCDGDWSDSGEQIFSDRSLSSGANSLSFSVPAGAGSGLTYARFRFTSYHSGGMPPTGAQDDGEVEDYSVTIQQTAQSSPPVADANGPYSGVINQLITFDGSGSYDPDEPEDGIISWEWDMDNDGDYDDASGETIQWQWRIPYSGTVGLRVTDTSGDSDTDTAECNIIAEMDFGDAPDPTYPTLIASNGARHIKNPDVFLGLKLDADPDGQPDPAAEGDDNDGNDDDDGVTFTSPLMQGSVATVTVVASTNGRLHAWIDFNFNGSWADPEDRIFNEQELSAGPNNLIFNVPPEVEPGITFARFRFTLHGDISYDGHADDGEVEDYMVELGGAGGVPGIDIEKSTNGEDADTPPGPTIQVGAPVTWTYVVTNTGDLPLTNITVIDDQGATVSCPKDTLDAGESMTCTATGVAVEDQYVNTGFVTGTLPCAKKLSMKIPATTLANGLQWTTATRQRHTPRS